MKKFKILIDCPWGNKGSLVTVEAISGAHILTANVTGGWVDPELYPGLFQEIEEVSDEEFLARKLFDIQKLGMAQQSILYMKLARELITNGLDVKKLREQK